MTPCPECIDGKGLVALFSSVRPCRTCAARRAEKVNTIPQLGDPHPFAGAVKMYQYISELGADGVWRQRMIAVPVPVGECP